MKNKTTFTRKEKATAFMISALLLVAAHLVPLNAVPAGETGRSAVNYGLPFTVLSTSTASYPTAPTTSEFYIWGLVANVAIVCVIVALVAYSIHSLKSSTKKS